MDVIADSVVAPVAAELGGFGEAVGMSVQLEVEVAQLRQQRAVRDARGPGLGEGALPRFVHTAYHLLGLRTVLHDGARREPRSGRSGPGRRPSDGRTDPQRLSAASSGPR